LDVKDIVWFSADGREMTEAHWHDANLRCLGVYFCGAAVEWRGEHGRSAADDDFLLLANAGHEDVAFVLPRCRLAGHWGTVFDTARDEESGMRRWQAEETYPVQSRSLVLLSEAASGG
jgi:glycogen operon protein